MFQRRMLIVASRLQNATLTAPAIFSRNEINKESGQQQPPISAEENDEVFTTGDNNANINQDSSLHKASLQFDILSIKLRNKTAAHSRPILAYLQHNFKYWSFILYLVVGTVFYMYDPGNGLTFVLAFYEAITIGYSVGLGTKDPDYR